MGPNRFVGCFYWLLRLFDHDGRQRQVFHTVLAIIFVHPSQSTFVLELRRLPIVRYRYMYCVASLIASQLLWALLYDAPAGVIVAHDATATEQFEPRLPQPCQSYEVVF